VLGSLKVLNMQIHNGRPTIQIRGGIMNTLRFVLLIGFSILMTGLAVAQGTPGDAFTLVETIRRADYPGSIPDSSGVGGDDVLAGYDLDKDGKGEIILITDNLAATAEGPAIIVFEATADNTYEPVWWYQALDHTNDNGSFPTMTVGDMDGDGNLEILAGIPYGNRPDPVDPDRFLVFEVDPSIDNGLPMEPTARWNFGANPTDNTRPSAMDVFDVDGDGTNEVVVIFRAWNNGGNAMMIFSLLGDFIGDFTTFSPEFFDDQNLFETDGNIYDVNIHDVNFDGTPEISVVEWEGEGVVNLYYQATAADQYQMVNKVMASATSVGDAGALGSFLPWDIDGDGTEEFMFGGSNGQVYIVTVPNGDVSQITGSNFSSIVTYPEQIRGAAIGDFDEDGMVDFMIAGSFNEKIFRVEYNGGADVTAASSYDTSTVYSDPDAGRYYYVAFPQDRKSIRDGQTLTDMDGDGLREIVFTDQQAAQLDSSIYVTILESTIPVSVELKTDGVLPKNFTLRQNYPNPFNPETMIEYEIPRAGNVTITVYNVLGKAVATLVDEYKGLGVHSVVWNGKDKSGNPVPSGVYVYTLVSGDVKISNQMTLLK